MTILDELCGSWSGLGQHYAGDSRDLVDTIQIEIDIIQTGDTKLSGRQTMNYVNQPELDRSFSFVITIEDDAEFTYQADNSDEPVRYTYLESPVSFQGASVTDVLGENTRTLDNNFIVGDQWQMNIEYQSANGSQSMVAEYVLDRNDDAETA